MFRRTDLPWALLVVAAFLAGAVPWSLHQSPSETMVWAFAVAPPLVLVALLGLRERRQAA